MTPIWKICSVAWASDPWLEFLKASFSFEEALHAYFRVGDVEEIQLQGLDATSFLDKTDRRAQKTQYGELRFSGETDSVFLNTRHEIELDDRSLHRVVRIQKQNSLTTVVWNPWVQKSAGMAHIMSVLIKTEAR